MPAAIVAEAQQISNRPTGKASEALEQLARAYALVTAGGTAVTTPNEATVIPLQTRAGGHQVGAPRQPSLVRLTTTVQSRQPPGRRDER